MVNKLLNEQGPSYMLVCREFTFNLGTHYSSFHLECTALSYHTHYQTLRIDLVQCLMGVLIAIMKPFKYKQLST